MVLPLIILAGAGIYATYKTGEKIGDTIAKGQVYGFDNLDVTESPTYRDYYQEYQDKAAPEGLSFSGCVKGIALISLAAGSYFILRKLK